MAWHGIASHIHSIVHAPSVSLLWYWVTLSLPPSTSMLPSSSLIAPSSPPCTSLPLLIPWRPRSPLLRLIFFNLLRPESRGEKSIRLFISRVSEMVHLTLSCSPFIPLSFHSHSPLFVFFFTPLPYAAFSSLSRSLADGAQLRLTCGISFLNSRFALKFHAIAAIPTTTPPMIAVLVFQLAGCEYQPPAGDQTCLG